MPRRLYDTATPNAHGYRDIHPSALRGRPTDVRIIDVREPSEFTGELEHISGAELWPLVPMPVN